VCLGARWLQVALIVHHARSRDPLPPGPQTPLTAVDSSKLKSGPDMSRHDPGGATAIIATVGQIVQEAAEGLAARRRGSHRGGADHKWEGKGRWK
jgi:hypothetical protein